MTHDSAAKVSLKCAQPGEFENRTSRRKSHLCTLDLFKDVRPLRVADVEISVGPYRVLGGVGPRSAQLPEAP